MAVFLNLFAFPIGADNLVDMLLTEFVLRFDLLELLAGVYEQDVVILLAAFFHHQDTGGDAGAIEDVGRETDNGVDVAFLLDEELTDLPLCRATEQNAVRRYAGHCSAVVEVVNHVEYEGVVRF